MIISTFCAGEILSNWIYQSILEASNKSSRPTGAIFSLIVWFMQSFQSRYHSAFEGGPHPPHFVPHLHSVSQADDRQTMEVTSAQKTRDASQ